MFLPFQSFEDGTELVCAPWKNGSTTVLLETPDEQYAFKTLKLTIPGCQMQMVYGFDDAETEYWLAFCKEHEEEIIEFAKKYSGILFTDGDFQFIGTGWSMDGVERIRNKLVNRANGVETSEDDFLFDRREF